jgi:hypothetical protein
MAPQGSPSIAGSASSADHASTILAPSCDVSTQTASGTPKASGSWETNAASRSASRSVAGCPSVGPAATAEGNDVGRPGILSIVSAPRSITTFAATAAAARSTTAATTSNNVRRRWGSDSRGRASDG